MSVTINGTSGLVFNDASTQNTAPKYGMVNRIINGAMMIDQRNAGALVSGAAGAIYPVDRTLIGAFGSATGRMSGQRSTTVPSTTTFTNSLIATVTTTDASPSADFGYCIRQVIEGVNTADLGWGTASAQPVTLSFWVRSSVTGTYAVCFQNADVTRAYSATYTISAANTWEQKTISIVGDTSGTWLTTNGAGIGVAWCLGGGSNRVAPSGSINAWSAGQASFNTITAITGGVNLLATSGATFYITGVQLEKGSTATSFDYRPYGTELALCQRYFQKSYNISVVPATVTSAGRICFGAWNNANGEFFQLRYPVPLRASPTITTYNPDTGSSNSIRNVSNGTNVTGSIQASGENGFTNLDVALITGSVYAVQYTASSEL